jgi:hypothetical protein
MIVITEKNKLNETLDSDSLTILNSLDKLKYRRVNYDGETRFSGMGRVNAYINSTRSELFIDVISEWAFIVPLNNIVKLTSTSFGFLIIIKTGKISLYK